MREIKFRAWCKTENRMINYNDFISLYSHIEMPTLDLWLNNELIDLMQYTGLKDKNGKDYYEHDIVKYNSMTGIIKFGFYADVRSCCEDVTGNGFYVDFHGFYITAFDEEMAKAAERIGNIHENPELLNGRNLRNIENKSTT